MLFNDAIQKFDAIIEKGKSYIIRNGSARPVNGKYRNVNDEIELSFTTTMEVEEIKERICYKISNSFLQFNEVPNFANGDIVIDIIGLVVKVKPAFIINVKRPSERTMKKREVTLLDSG
ncbi:Hypothetical predicted protein [Olea europaea subsp. europaea]|uniref:Uncharacterized protein n=1 Tax=Olea europaea subsp. europaea TaxID=158383 RepID=A0A8S0S061_OLEEU|nr:Hypothetical predicted protein [Olea europaea subsp. europaea]